jgi:methylated-DNA-[protein]-cysteine S-methyltransferase
MITTWYATLDSPIGHLLLVKSGEALSGLYMQVHARGPTQGAAWREDPTRFDREATQVREYFDGARTHFDLPLDLAGTPFQRRVWELLRLIPYAETVSYGALARALGLPGASRAVGTASARNPVSIVVPCHRVIGKNGELAGYAGGVERKRWLIEWEARQSVSRATSVTLAAPFQSCPPAFNGAVPALTSM